MYVGRILTRSCEKQLDFYSMSRLFKVVEPELQKIYSPAGPLTKIPWTPVEFTIAMETSSRACIGIFIDVSGRRKCGMNSG